MNELFESALRSLENREFLRAFELLTRCHGGGFRADEARELLLDAFHRPGAERFRALYEKNVAALKHYPHIAQKHLDGTKGALLALPGGWFSVYDAGRREFSPLRQTATGPAPGLPKINGLVPLIYEICDAGLIDLILKASDAPGFLTQKTPAYIHYDSFEPFSILLQTADISPVAASGRAVFAFGREELEAALLAPKARQPEFVYAPDRERERKVAAFFESISARRAAACENSARSIEAHYAAVTPAAVAERIRSRSARVGIITSRFTSAVQYYLRDCARALRSLGFDCRVLIEESDLESVGTQAHVAFIDEFRPELILVANHFRWEESKIPPGVVFISWLQDFLPRVFSKETASRIGPLDFVMNLFYSSREFAGLGYPPENVVAAPMLADAGLYKKYELTAEESALFATDVCCISNSGDPDASFGRLMKFFEKLPGLKTLESSFINLRERIFEDLYSEKSEYSGTDAVRLLLEGELEKIGISLTGDSFDEAARIFKYEVISDIKKVVPLLWLHEKGYKMKLWGKPWPKHPVLKKYAMGVAANGETMSKILNASRISLGQNNAITLHPRLLESTLSGCLYIGNAIAPEDDMADARKYLKEGYELVLYRGRADLYRKIDYFLGNKYEIKKVVSAGQRRIKERLTYEALMCGVLDFVASRLEKA